MGHKLFIGLFALIMLISGCTRDKITEQEAEKIARNTEEVKKFLEFYGKCEDCNPAYLSLIHI